MVTGAAIVTGSSGEIGSAIAGVLASNGFCVSVGYCSNRAQAEEIVNQIEGRGGCALAIGADITHEDDVKKLFEITTQTFGYIGALVNCAGIIGMLSRVETAPLEMVRRVIEVNVVGTFLCCREAVRLMSTKNRGGGGSIVNISSRASSLGNPNEWVHYAMSKGAIDTFTVGLAKEVASEGIRVNAVNPGLINTRIHERAGADGRLSRLVSSVPMGRTGTPSEVANAVRFLISSEASYITGACLDVSGGR
jgi:NAD(P)-dependent dehydrogenase (short-subunit alcohol dehydrogenase family)